jgi:hypothetical protein
LAAKKHIAADAAAKKEIRKTNYGLLKKEGAGIP